jgi:prepilin-type N-terminal cleavage/methylation domain-containing protein/prepilin-type processing-associated H-X9-DG protein
MKNRIHKQRIRNPDTGTGSRRRRRRRGFTLVELLAVIVIIGVLAGILIPVLATIKSRARSATCISNLRQSGLLLLQYANENRHIIPTRRKGPGTSWVGWGTLLNEKGYLDMNTTTGARIGERIYTCPLGYNDTVNSAGDQQAYGANIDAWTRDGSNRDNVHWGKSWLGEDDSLKIDNCSWPGGFVLLADSFCKWTYDNRNGRQGQKSIFGEPSSLLWMRHHGGQNVLLVDGHVERITPVSMTRFFPKNITGGYWMDGKQHVQ